jgi:ferredoxin
MRVSIDHDRCTGHGRCYVLAPELFVDDDEGYGQVIDDGEVAPDQIEAARNAVSNCPERAVLLDEV